MNIDLKGRVALVTGASKGLGREIALKMAFSGADVACLFQSNKDSAESVANEIIDMGRKAKIFQVDLENVNRIQEVIRQVYNELGKVDILVNNAAIRPKNKIEDVTIDEWDQVLNVNLRAAFFMTQGVIKGMRKKQWGRIINVSGISAYLGNNQRSHVIASKLGVVGLTKALANETARWGITVNVIVPGVMDTKRETQWYGDLQQHFDERIEKTPKARLGKPEEVAHACVFLASNESDFITGQELFVSGGLPLMRHPNQEY